MALWWLGEDRERDVKINVICPATDVHIRKYTNKNTYGPRTPALYEKYVKPYIRAFPASEPNASAIYADIMWFTEIMQHEAHRIVQEKWNLGPGSLRISFSRPHRERKYQGNILGMAVGHAHLLDDVISLIPEAACVDFKSNLRERGKQEKCIDILVEKKNQQMKFKETEKKNTRNVQVYVYNTSDMRMCRQGKEIFLRPWVEISCISWQQAARGASGEGKQGEEEWELERKLKVVCAALKHLSMGGRDSRKHRDCVEFIGYR
ncbi:hypothetical protein BJ912DRAFT_1088571 [Pholiota molesta]|nr:hypothetical protein BJ912DRAFT_1088571 [Pholiota molesta]